jgi:RNA polymerase sigma factor for flagellar operon FliA
MTAGVDAASDTGSASTAPSTHSVDDASGVPDDLEQLWRDFKATGSTQARDRLIVHYAPLVKYVAGRMTAGLPGNIDHEDLTSAGIVGLMEAISKFEPGRGYKFETYAANRIRGSILDDLRAMDWVPRSVRTQARRVEQTLQKLYEHHGRTPTDDEVASEMGVSVRKLRAIYSRVSTVLFVSLERLLSLGDKQGGLSLVETLADAQAEDPASHVEAEEMRSFLAKAISGLPERERMAITLYYYEGLSLTEIAQVVGLSQARISQMNAKSVLQFRSQLNKLPKR